MHLLTRMFELDEKDSPHPAGCQIVTDRALLEGDKHQRHAMLSNDGVQSCTVVHMRIE
jgi:hypothetical protein